MDKDKLNIKIKFDGDESKIFEALDKLIELNDCQNEINITNIISSKIEDILNVEDVTDFNGWQCDWWSKFYYKNVKFSISGGAWYGTAEISIYDEDEYCDDEE